MQNPATQLAVARPVAGTVPCMFDALRPVLAALGMRCCWRHHTFERGDRAWEVGTLHAPGVGARFLCPPCARPQVKGVPGRSAAVVGLQQLQRVHAAVTSPGLRHSEAPAPFPTSATGWGRLAGLGVAVAFAGSGLAAVGGATPAVATAGVVFAAAGWVLALVCLVAKIASRPHVSAALPASPVRHRTAARGPVDSWARGARGERETAAALEATGLLALHDRIRPGTAANIDHIVVGRDAVYVVDAKNYNRGGLRARAGRLFIGERDETTLVHGVAGQAGHVRQALRREGFGGPVVPVLCLTGSSRPVAGSRVADVRLSTPEDLAHVVAGPGPLRQRADAERLADLLAWLFPPA